MHGAYARYTYLIEHKFITYNLHKCIYFLCAEYLMTTEIFWFRVFG
jgi:hypothetical protein